MLDLELIDQMTHDAIRVEALAEQFPYAGARFVELEDAAGRQINQSRRLV